MRVDHLGCINVAPYAQLVPAAAKLLVFDIQTPIEPTFPYSRSVWGVT